MSCILDLRFDKTYVYKTCSITMFGGRELLEKDKFLRPRTRRSWRANDFKFSHAGGNSAMTFPNAGDTTDPERSEIIDSPSGKLPRPTTVLTHSLFYVLLCAKA